MELNGVPLHPLVVHAAVVLTPLAALTALAYVVPRFRVALRWPLVGLALVAMVSVQGAVLSGADLLESTGMESALIATHQERAELLRNVMVGFTLVAVGAAFLLPRRGRDGIRRPAPGKLVSVLVSLLLVVGAVAVAVLVVLTGDAGSQSVWGAG